jgi:hypothetical protein
MKQIDTYCMCLCNAGRELWVRRFTRVLSTHARVFYAKRHQVHDGVSISCAASSRSCARGCLFIRSSDYKADSTSVTNQRYDSNGCAQRNYRPLLHRECCNSSAWRGVRGLVELPLLEPIVNRY